MSDLEQTPKNPKFIASGILIGLIVLAAIVLAVVYAFDGAGDPKGSPGGTPSTTAPRAESSSVCGLPDSQATGLTEAPSTKWRIIGTSAVPESKTTGPAEVKSNIPRCFSRSPEGALFAATWLTVLLNEPEFATEALARARMVPSDELDRFLAAGDGTAETKIPAQVAGFRVEDYSPDRSTVSVIVRLTDGPDMGSLLQLVMTMVWQAGDWKWELSPAGIQGNAVASLGGFVAWNGLS